MLLHHLTWAEVDAYLARSTGIIIPIGSTEQHGPNGLIGTDALCAEDIALGVGERAEALVGPTQAVGMAQHHMAFSGSMTLRPSTLVAVIRDQVMSLVEHGFTHIFYLNGHGGNVATVTAAFSEIWREERATRGESARPISLKLMNWWDPPPVMAAARRRFGAADGSHATASEVSVTQHFHPETIKQAVMDPEIAPRGPIRDAADYRRRFPDGRIGSNPGLATPEAGKELTEVAVEALTEAYHSFLRD